MKKILLLTIFFCLKLVYCQDENKIKLPFDFLQYQLWFDSYSHGETDEKPYGWPIRASKELEQSYIKKWDNDTICGGFMYLDTKFNQFQLYLAVCDLKDDSIPFLAYRLITFNMQNEVIDGMTASMSIGDGGDWKRASFYISENLEITLYKNKTDRKKVLESKISGKYKIKEDGKFEKIQ